MSSFIWECIRQEDLDANDYLLELKQDPISTVRPPEVDDKSFNRSLQSELFEVDLRCKNLQDILQSLSSRVDGLSSTRSQMTGKEREAEDEEFAKFNEEVRYANTIRLLKVALRTNERIRTDILKVCQDTPAVKPTAPAIVPRQSTSAFALPTLQLPVFNGEPTEWSSFWDRFKYAVHEIDDERLPPVIKLSHLLNSVRGLAREVISGLPINDSSYQIAVKLLTDRFGSKDTNIKLLYGRLEMLKCHGKEGGSLLKFSNELEKILLQLEHLGEDVKSYNLYLSIVKKLPYYLLKEIVHEEKTTPRDKQLQMVRDKIRSTIQERDDVDLLVQRSAMPTRQSFNPVSSSNQIRRPQLAIEDRVASLTFATATSRPNLPCLLCDSTTHHSPECDKFQSLESRVNKLKQLRRCSKCARLGHPTSACQQQLKCASCRSDGHLTMLCRHRFGPTRTTSTNQRPSGSTNTTRFAAPPLNSNFSTNPGQSNTVEASTNINNVFAKRSVLLKCVQIEVINPQNPCRRDSVLAMFDDGSTTSYIASSLVGRLKLHRSHSSVLSYGVFGDPTPRNVLSDVVSFTVLSTRGTPISMSAQSVKFLSRPVPHALVDTLEADEIPNTTPTTVAHKSPEILIGMDFYNDFCVRHHYDLVSGFSLFDSKLGFIISGSSNSIAPSDTLSNSVITLHSAQSIDSQVSKFFDMETIGIDDSLARSTSLITFQDSIKFNGDRYEVRLPWNHVPPSLPNNNGLSLGRLRSTVRSLQKTPELLRKHDEIIVDQRSQGVVEEVPTSQRYPHDRPCTICRVNQSFAKTRAKSASFTKIQPNFSIRMTSNRGETWRRSGDTWRKKSPDPPPTDNTSWRKGSSANNEWRHENSHFEHLCKRIDSLAIKGQAGLREGNRVGDGNGSGQGTSTSNPNSQIQSQSQANSSFHPYKAPIAPPRLLSDSEIGRPIKASAQRWARRKALKNSTAKPY